MKKLWGILIALAIAYGLAPAAQAVTLNPEGMNPRSSLAVVYSDGTVAASPNGYEARPALSLSKLYLGYWVLYNGAPHHKAQVEQMLRVSDDNIANNLDRTYPQAIDEIARQFGLGSTYRNGYWGSSRTSAVDVSRFIEAIKPDPVAAPVFRGMAGAAPIAADGFAQNYGTSRLPGVQGTKFGWSNDRVSVTATASYGHGFSAAVITYGDAAANTNDALRGFGVGPAVGPIAHPAPGSAPGQQPLTSSFGPIQAPAQRVVDALPPETPVEITNAIPRDWLVPTGAPGLIPAEVPAIPLIPALP
ncbi:hypothetical protein [Corynebacterium cystitidis]|uniref:hypothetical protein n=1 Tax=Corynebacterium cystitidis TaxID=35757 RepID=UPI00211DC19A|nr:hypothetical protein [Corynebacterium cystitidis]